METAPQAWYCPSRWLLAHNDAQANILTWSSHMCLADLNNDGENLLALVDFKQSLRKSMNEKQQQQSSSTNKYTPPYECRLRIYRGQQLIYNHFLDDLPSCLTATSIKTSAPTTSFLSATSNQQQNKKNESDHSYQATTNCPNEPLLALTINEEVYFYHKLKPSHRISLEDHPNIIKTFNKSEFEAWQMVRENLVEVEALRELLSGLRASNKDSSSPAEPIPPLSSHSMNFLALETNEERQNYLLAWKFKRLNNGIGEHLMSMDTICCAAARLNYASEVTRSGDYGATRDRAAMHNAANLTAASNCFAASSGISLWNWNRILDIQRDGLILGTEDGHLLIYELRSKRALLECNYRLPSSPDHILVERRSPANFGFDRQHQQHIGTEQLKRLTYKVLVSCRNCRIYSIDQTYLEPRSKCDSESDNNINKIKELLVLKCNAVDMCWSGDYEDYSSTMVRNEGGLGSQPNFIVGCLDKRVYCFNSSTGQCKWMVEGEVALNCIISLPTPKVDGPACESSLIGVASQANRIDFYVSLTGRIVDSIYFNNNDHCKAMTFGRFGHEDNCLCVVTELGRLMIFILKRTAKFSSAQCLSSAASYATYALINSVSRHASPLNIPDEHHTQQLKRKEMSEAAKLPSAFSLSKLSVDQSRDGSSSTGVNQLDHNCDQVQAKGVLEAQLQPAQLQIPLKGRDFVDQIVDQSQKSTAMSCLFTKHLLKLKERMKIIVRQQRESNSTTKAELLDGNRISLTKVVGLGSMYRVSFSLRLDLRSYFENYLSQREQTSQPIGSPTELETNQLNILSSDSFVSMRKILVSLFLFLPNNKQQQATQLQVKPFKFDISLELESLAQKHWIYERTFEVKLARLSRNEGEFSNAQQPGLEEESMTIDAQVLVRLSNVQQQKQNRQAIAQNSCGLSGKTRYSPILISSVHIPPC